MAIKKFVDFINEDVKIPVVDILVDDDGNIYNGIKPEFPLRKGNISQKSIGNIVQSTKKVDKAGNPVDVKSSKLIIDYIQGSDDKSYPLGIDKNGYLVYPDGRVDEDGFILNKDNEVMTVDDDFFRLYNNEFVDNKWRAFIPTGNNTSTKVDYSFLLPMTPTGWVNVKIDMEVLKRVRRYALSLGDNDNGFESFVSKLEEMQEISSRDPETKRKGAPKKRVNIQKEMSVIILLHYINEIKDFFTPGSSGFLFESFLAGLIPNSKVIDDNGVADVVADGFKYQMKLYSNTYKYIPVNRKTPNDYYAICIKNPQSIEVFLIDGNNSKVIKDISVSTGFKLEAMRLNKGVKRFEIKLSRIEEKIELIGAGLKSSLDSLYAELSAFQYNVETIITGVDNKGNVIDENEFNTLENSAGDNVKSMKEELTKLVRSVNRREVMRQERDDRNANPTLF